LKILFDEDIPDKLARSLTRHEIHTVVSMQWGGIENGALLTLIERDRFEIFLTGDKNMGKQQRLEGRPFAVLVLSAIDWPVVSPHIQKISVALDQAQPVRSTRLIAGCSFHVRNAHADKSRKALNARIVPIGYSLVSWLAILISTLNFIHSIAPLPATTLS
jgi:predicted nuclease of predicted toxin-antitoxin system